MNRLLFLLVLIGLTSSANGQDWTQLPVPITQQQERVPYFINPELGFVYNDGWIPEPAGSTPNVMKTTDGGQTWAAVTFFDSILSPPTQMYFVSTLHGYAAVSWRSGYWNGNSNLPGIYETTDGGTNWKKITPYGLGFSAVYASKGAVFAQENTPEGDLRGPLYFSRDGGAQWDSITKVNGLIIRAEEPRFLWIAGNGDSLVATIYLGVHEPDQNPNCDYLVFSTDLGSHWNSMLLDSTLYGYSLYTLYIPPHSCNIIRSTFLKGETDNTYSFLKASPNYSLWDTSIFQQTTAQWMEGSGCISYLPSYHRLDRSTDQGRSWQHLSLPTELFEGEMDDNFGPLQSVTGYGAVVYGIDINGGVWKTTDGGDGSLTSDALAPRFALDHSPFASGSDTLFISQCENSIVEMHNQNIGCAYAKFDSISIDGLLPAEYSILSTYHCSCQSLPDTSLISLQSITPGIRDVAIHYHFTDDEYNQIDTSFNIVLDVKSGGTSVALGLHLRDSTITPIGGNSINIPVYLSGSIKLTGVTSIELPFQLDTNILGLLSFDPAISGISVGSFRHSNGGLTVPVQANDLTVSGETLLGSLRCIVYVTDTLQTSVSLAGATLSTEEAYCISLSLQKNNIDIALSSCVDSTLLQFMKTGQLPLGIQSIVPNPATDEVQINFINPTSSSISYQVLDALGQTRLKGTAGGNVFSLDISSLPQGVYFFRASNGTGFSASSKLVIIR